MPVGPSLAEPYFLSMNEEGNANLMLMDNIKICNAVANRAELIWSGVKAYACAYTRVECEDPITVTPTVTLTDTGTQTDTRTVTPTSTITLTFSLTLTATSTDTSTQTVTVTATSTPTITVTMTEVPCIACGGQFEYRGMYAYNSSHLSPKDGSAWGPAIWDGSGSPIYISEGSGQSVTGFMSQNARIAFPVTNLDRVNTFISLYFQVYEQSGAAEMTVLDISRDNYQIKMIVFGPDHAEFQTVRIEYSEAGIIQTASIPFAYVTGPYNDVNTGYGPITVGRTLIGIELGECGLRIYPENGGPDSSGTLGYQFPNFGPGPVSADYFYAGNNAAGTMPVNGYLDDVRVWTCADRDPTETSSPTFSITLIATQTPTSSITQTVTPSHTLTVTVTDTQTRTETVTQTATSISTQTFTVTSTPACVCGEGDYCYPGIAAHEYEFNDTQFTDDGPVPLNGWKVGAGDLTYSTYKSNPMVGRFSDGLGSGIGLCPCMFRNEDGVLEWDQLVDLSALQAGVPQVIFHAILGILRPVNEPKGFGIYIEEDGAGGYRFRMLYSMTPLYGAWNLNVPIVQKWDVSHSS